MNTIEIYSKNVYGVNSFYAANLSQAAAIKKLTGQKTLTSESRAGLEMLGFKLVVVFEPQAILA